MDVCFGVKNSLLRSIIPPTEGTKKFLSLQLDTAVEPVTLVSNYAPTLFSSVVVKDNFYDELNSAIRSIPDTQSLLVLGDFNASVGADYTTWPSCLGYFEAGRMNGNVMHLLELCCHLDLCVANTFFNTKLQHPVSWRLDLVLIRSPSLPCIKLSRSYRSADCNTEHSLVCSKAKLQTRRICHTKKTGRSFISTSNTRNPIKVEGFVAVLEKCLPGPQSKNALERLERLRDAAYTSAMSVFGKQINNANWLQPCFKIQIRADTSSMKRNIMALNRLLDPY